MDQAMRDSFRQLLALDREPVALRWYSKVPSDLPLLPEKARFCAKLMRAMQGDTFYATLEQEDCAGGARYCGLQDPDELTPGRRSGEFLVSWGVFKSVPAVQRAFQANPAIAPGTFVALAFAPLSSAPYEPDVIFVLCNARQGMELLHANAYDAGARARGADAAPICSSMAALPYLTGQVTYGFGDVGSQEHMGLGPSDVMVSLPGNDLGRIVANLQEMRTKRSFRYAQKRQAAQAARDAAGMLPDDLQQHLRGFQASRALLSAVELDLWSAVGDGATAEQVAAKRSTHPRATAMLLDALVALDVLGKTDGRYHQTPVSERYLMQGARDDARAAILHTAHLWPRWSTLTECVRQGTSVTYQEMVERDDEWTESFIAAMHRNASARAPLVVRTVGVQGARRMLDVGGGSGAYSIAFARANPALQVEVFDLPTVLPIAQGHIDEAGLADRILTRAGDLRTDALGEGYDLILLSAICHMLGPEGNADLIRRCFTALAPGGRLVIQDFVLTPDRTEPRVGALFALNMLVGTPEGSSYSSAEYLSWLEGAGFQDRRHVTLPGPTGLVLGTRP